VPGHACLAPDARPVQVGDARAALDAGGALQVTGPPAA